MSDYCTVRSLILCKIPMLFTRLVHHIQYFDFVLLDAAKHFKFASHVYKTCLNDCIRVSFIVTLEVVRFDIDHQGWYTMFNISTLGLLNAAKRLACKSQFVPKLLHSSFL